ncbi:secreted protein [Mycena rebaudengoi]|nr:secreted protein [Mycena rebaudengoi]
MLPQLLTLSLALFGLSAASLLPSDNSTCRLPALQDVYLSAGFNYTLNCAPGTGALHALMLFVDFPDAVAPSSETPQSLHDFFLPEAAEWYANASYGKLVLNVTADTSKFYRMPAQADSYGWQRGLTSEAHQQYIQDAVGIWAASPAGQAYLAAAGTAAPLADVLYVVPTRMAAAISFSPTYMGEVYTRLVSGSDSSTYVARKAVTFGADAYSTWGFKTLNHETGHTMCLPDYYPLPSGPTGQYVGGWDLMGLISGPGPDYFAWDKWRLGWLADADVGCLDVAAEQTGSFVLTALGKAPVSGGTGDGVKAVVVKVNTTTVVVAELRTREGLDAGLCKEGVLLYTVQTDVETGKGSVKVVDTMPGSGGCAGDELNDAPLSVTGTGVTQYTVPGTEVTVQVGAKSGDGYTVQVSVSGAP